jgi:glycosyltransferase involved in cell wall biosynthesis
MKVCVITTWPPHMDGIAQYSRELYTQMKDFIDIKIIANKLETTNKSDEHYVERCWRRNDILYPFKIFHSILKEKPDIVHIQHGWLLYGRSISPLLFILLLLMLRLKRIPTVVTVHTLVKKETPIYKNVLINAIVLISISAVTKLIFKLSTKIILHTYMMKNFAVNAYGLKKEEEKITVIPHGSKIPHEMADVPREKDEVRILFLGFIRKEKGLECLASAFNSVVQTNKNVKLIIVGGRHAHDRPNYVKYLKAMFPQELLEKVCIKGFVDDKALDSILYGCDIIVLTSKEHNFLEVSGALYRVACYGKPVICSRVPKFTCELHDGEDCIFVEPCNSVNLAGAILFLIKNPFFRMYLGENLKKNFSSKHWAKISEGHIKLYRSVLGQQRKHD